MNRLFATAVLAVAIATAGAPAARAAEAPAFQLGAQVSGLYPNATITAPVQVHNPQDYDVTVVSTQVLVADANAGCDASNLEATPVGGDVPVAAGGDGAVPVQFHMAAAAPDACQGATFPLTFVATGAVSESSSGSSNTGGSTPSGIPFTGAGRLTLGLVAGGVAALLVGLLLPRARRRES